MRPRSDGPATEGSSGAAGADELARENRRLRRENRRLRERLDAERTERQAIIDRYEGLVDDPDATGSPRGGAWRPAREAGGANRGLAAAFARFAGLLGLR